MQTEELFIVGIGSSAGGVPALKEFFTAFKKHDNICFVVASHLPNNSNTALDRVIGQVTTLPVSILGENEKLVAGRIYIVPGNLKATIDDGIVILRERRQDEVVNTVIDEFFLSLAADQRRLAVGIILSGAGNDGAHGVKVLHERGGLVMVQEPGSAMHKTMPSKAIDADSPQEISSPLELALLLPGLVDDRLKKRVP